MQQYTILHIQPDTIRQKLTAIGASCIIPLRRIQRYIFSNPSDSQSYIDIQYENGKIISYYKDSETTLEVIVDNIEVMRKIYGKCGLQEKSMQEFYRETWYYNGVHIYLERRPGLRPFLKVTSILFEQIQICLQGLGYTDTYYENGIYSVGMQMKSRELNKKNPPQEKNQISMRKWTQCIQGNIVDIYYTELGIPSHIFEKLAVVSFDNPPILST